MNTKLEEKSFSLFWENKILKELIKGFLEFSKKKDKKIDFLQREISKYKNFDFELIIPSLLPSEAADEIGVSSRMLVALLDEHNIFEKPYLAIRKNRIKKNNKTPKSATTVLISPFGLSILKIRIKKKFNERLKKLATVSKEEQKWIDKNMKIPSDEELKKSNWYSIDEVFS